MKTLNPEITEIQFKIIVDLPKGENPTDNSIESLRQRLSNGEIKDIFFVDCGQSWGSFGVEVQVNKPELIELKSKEIYSLINRILRTEKPKPPTPPKKETEYQMRYDISKGNKQGLSENKHGLEQCYLKRTIYPDGREFDVLHLRGNCLEKISKNLKDEKHPILKELHFALPFSYGILQNSLAITFAEGSKMNYSKFLDVVNEVMKHTYYFKK